MAPLKGRGKTQMAPKAVMSSGDSQQAITAQAAARYHLSPETLWGVYGTESSFGQDPSTSSAGAEGPMQFLPSTGAEYGLNATTIQQFMPSMFAAAKYLHNLGADANPTSPKTKAALNGYNGNKGGTSETSYTKSVIEKGKQYGGKNSKTSPAEKSEGEGGGGFSTSASLWDLLTGNLDALGSQVALLALGMVKDIGVGAWDYIIAPAWHWNQRTVAWYTHFTLDPKGVGDGSETQWAMLWTAAFWSLGYVLLWADEDSLSPVPVHRSRAAAHIRKLQALPARRDLIKPKDVKRNTPKKPKPIQSRASLTQVDTMNTTRNRPVKVTSHAGNGTQTEAPIQRDGTINAAAEPDSRTHSRTGAHEGSRGNPPASTEQGQGQGNQA